MEAQAILEILATITGIMMSLAYYPQVYKIWKRKSAKDVSVLAFAMLAVGTTVWLLWGLSTGSIPIITGFAAGAVGSNLVLFSTLYYNSKIKEKH